MQGGACRKKKNGVQLKKHRRFQKNYRLQHRTPLRVRANIKTFTYVTEEYKLTVEACSVVNCSCRDDIFVCSLPAAKCISRLSLEGSGPVGFKPALDQRAKLEQGGWKQASWQSIT